MRFGPNVFSIPGIWVSGTSVLVVLEFGPARIEKGDAVWVIPVLIRSLRGEVDKKMLLIREQRIATERRAPRHIQYHNMDNSP
jgi:hypothetical protein